MFRAVSLTLQCPLHSPNHMSKSKTTKSRSNWGLPPRCKTKKRFIVSAETALVNDAHNSTRVGTPFPTTWSKLAGVSSTTFDAATLVNRAARTENENFMVEVRVTVVEVLTLSFLRVQNH